MTLLETLSEIAVIAVNLLVLQTGTGVIAAVCAYKKEDMREAFIAAATYRIYLVSHKIDRARYMRYLIAMYAVFILLVNICSSFK